MVQPGKICYIQCDGRYARMTTFQNRSFALLGDADPGSPSLLVIYRQAKTLKLLYEVSRELTSRS